MVYLFLFSLHHKPQKVKQCLEEEQNENVNLQEL